MSLQDIKTRLEDRERPWPAAAVMGVPLIATRQEIVALVAVAEAAAMVRSLQRFISLDEMDLSSWNEELRIAEESLDAALARLEGDTE